jgi:selenocysteine insertion sequence-binding protein 2
MGIREVTKHLKLAKLKCIILAPNCEKIQSKGGLDDAINNIIKSSIDQDVPFLFALGRKGLGKAVNKLVPISVVGIFDYSGAEVNITHNYVIDCNLKISIFYKKFI